MTAQAGLSLSWSKTPKTGFLVTKLICFMENCGKLPMTSVFTLPEPESSLSTFVSGTSSIGGSGDLGALVVILEEARKQ